MEMALPRFLDLAELGMPRFRQRENGVRVLFFTTEHSRESGLKSELGKVRRFEKLTNKALNNKFFLARVEL